MARKGAITPQGENIMQIDYVPLATLRKWDDNPKLHDLEKMVRAFETDGFVDPPKFESSLNHGAGGLVNGNGRMEALQLMKERGLLPPRGIDVGGDGEWLIPIYFGNEIGDEKKAAAFAIDDNNLTMAGGNFTPVYMTQMYNEEKYIDVLRDVREMGELPVTVDEIDLEVFQEYVIGGSQGYTRKDRGVPVRWGKYKFRVPRDGFKQWVEALEARFDGDLNKIIGELRRMLHTPSPEAAAMVAAREAKDAAVAA
ncbi:MAG: hypothetical protein FOGNACKC_00894 [Anaerolineae bacterium]|nr:hypothetical protein [Anaerolineae bacterium]